MLNLKTWDPHKKFLASVALFLATGLVPNQVSFLAVFVSGASAGLSFGETWCEEREKFRLIIS